LLGSRNPAGTAMSAHGVSTESAGRYRRRNLNPILIQSKMLSRPDPAACSMARVLAAASNRLLVG
jgi:hypothetical protein